MKRTLAEYAKEKRVTYRTAWNWFKANRLPGAYKNEFGKIIVPIGGDKPEYTICYARVSSSQNKAILESQAEHLVNFCAANGWKVSDVIKERGSGLNDKRPKLIKALKSPDVTRVVIEHSDRLTRFGFNYLSLWMEEKGCEIVVINEAANDREDLMQDFVKLVTSFVARLYGLRRSKRRTERLIEELSDEGNQSE